ncbi:hypothetical protein [Pseudalkalibacillus berkeleyi]|uniref:Glycosyltransferase RgtA/B/C/D-like domain-containing protein n=1 Tax=Pseudalkalibacillus berkeleyi TaxID=1069813 RepID=A0ABS9H551_9BACL|nr:hypothetical protein [Pseudalkalibacillus berkeleyi]MCF6138820.1 hypothetical protein [Pseudalkalibacillus berkeleyi]
MNNETFEKHETKQVFALLIVFFIMMSSILTFSFSVFIMQIILGFITIPLIMKKNYKTARIYTIIFVVSIFFVFLVYLANQMNYGSPYYIGGSDDLMFEQEGLDVHNAGIYNPFKILELNILPNWHNSSFFVVYIAVLIKFSNLFGDYTTFLPLMINVYFLLWITMLFEYFIRKYAKFSDLKTNLSIAAFALTPNIQYINSHVFRDSFNLLQIFLIIFLVDKILSNKNYIRKIFFVLILALLVYTTYFTRTNALVFAGAICLFIFVEKFRFKKSYLILIGLPIILLSNFHEFIKLDRFIEGYSNYILNQAENGLSAFIFEQTLLPFGIFLRTVYAFITPFPNFLGLFNNTSSVLYDFVFLLIYIGVLFQILAIPFIIKRIFKFDWLAICFLTLFMGVIATTFTFRHIMLYYPFMVALAIDAYIETSKRRKIGVLYVGGFIGFSLALIYISMKLLS